MLERMLKNSITVRQSGHSLVEMIMVIVIVGILLMSLASIFMGDILNSRADAAAQKVVTDIAYAQKLAFSSGIRHWVVFYPGSESYTIFPEDTTNPGTRSATPVNNPLTQTAYTILFDQDQFQGVTLASADFNSTTELQFSSKGVPTDASGTPLASAGQVVLSGGRSVTVEPISGVAHRD